MPADGGPLTRDDARTARDQHASLAAEITEFRRFRDQPKPAFAIADLNGGSFPPGSRASPQTPSRT